MRLSDLSTYVEIVEAGGLTPAARRMGITQPALSRTLRELETRMGAQLLRRTGRGIETTPAGDVFLGFARETLAAFYDTRRRVLEKSDSLPRQMTLSVPLRLGRLLIPELHREFARRLPDTTLHVLEERTDRARDLADRAEIDAAIVYAPSEGSAPGLIRLFSEALFAVGTIANLGPPDTPLGLAELATLPLIVPSRGDFRKRINAAFTAEDLTPRITRTLESAEALLAFASEGEGVGIVPMSNAYLECQRGEVVARPIVEPEIVRAIALLPGRTMSRNTLRVCLPAIRQSLGRAAPLAHWRRAAHR